MNTNTFYFNDKCDAQQLWLLLKNNKRHGLQPSCYKI